MTDYQGPYRYQRYSPGRRLAGFVKFFYCFRGRSSQPERILPLGTTEITCNLEGGGVKAYIVPPGCAPYFVVPEMMDRTVGICFSSWGLHGLLNVSPLEVGNEKAPLGDMLPGVWRELSGHIGDCGSLRTVMCGLERWLAGKIGIAPGNLAADAVDFIDSRRGQLELPELYRRYAVSDRRLQMTFRESIGMSPKRYCRLKRFHFAVTRLKTATSLTSLALDAGYFDQSHFIHEFRDFAGTYPLGLMRESNRLNAINARAWF